MRRTIQKENLILGKERKEHFLVKETLMMKISRQRMHTIFVKKDCGREVRKKENNTSKRWKTKFKLIIQLLLSSLISSENWRRYQHRNGKLYLIVWICLLKREKGKNLCRFLIVYCWMWWAPKREWKPLRQKKKISKILDKQKKYFLNQNWIILKTTELKNLVLIRLDI